MFSAKRKYNIIYADPPWKYDRKVGQGVAEDHYHTMNIEDICSLPVGAIAADDCVLFFVGDVSVPYRRAFGYGAVGVQLSDLWI